jgi:hypothetical protein
MASPDELRAAIEEARSELRRAIEAASGAWERSQGAEAGSPWSCRELAEQVLGDELLYTSAICEACGYAGLPLRDRGLPTAQAALAELERVAALCDGRTKYVTEGDLSMRKEGWGSVEEMLVTRAARLRHCAERLSLAVTG